jgi:NAD+ synthase (glutamine-hydrolysing)
MLITLAQLNFTVGNIEQNYNQIISAIEKAKEDGSDIVVTTEMALTGYPPLDLLLQPGFLETVDHYINKIIPYTKGLCLLLGVVRKNDFLKEKFLHNSIAIIQDGKLMGYYDKQLLPTYDVFDERRYFEPGKKPYIFLYKNKKVALSICEDMWQIARDVKETCYQVDPIEPLKTESIDFFINLSASPYSYEKQLVRLNILKKISTELNCYSIFCNQVGANDGLLFDGNSMIVDSKGQLVFKAPCFSLNIETINLQKTQNVNENPDYKPLEELFLGIVTGITDYFHKSGFTKAVLGLSGGIDSALVALLAKEALGKENVFTYFMPSCYSSSESKKDAEHMAKLLGVYYEEISIDPLFHAFKHVLSDVKKEVTLENLQARIRAMILMAQSNEKGALLLNTSNKSELAMGYSTLYGDSAGALSPIGDLYKTQVYELAKLTHLIPLSIIEKEPTAELKFNQKDSDTLPPYPLLDQLLKSFIEENETEDQMARKLKVELPFVKKIVHTFFLNEYKRKQCPLILRVSTKGLTPLIGRIVPTVQGFK